MKVLAVFLASGTVSLAATFPLRQVALKFGLLDLPGRRKIHREPVPYLGGLAVLVGMSIGIYSLDAAKLPILALLVLVAGLGIADDLGKASVPLKLLAEIALALAAIMLGVTWHLTSSVIFNDAVSMLWIVGLTNSFNLLDNMDGLSSTAAATSLVALALIDPTVVTFSVPLAGALVGFLYLNRPPARMFLGDAGSLMIGYGVAVASITVANSMHGPPSVILLAFPVVLACFDTSLVIVSRQLSHRPIQVGDRDHFSHRLQLLGWSPGQILVATFAVTATGGLIGYAAAHYPGAASWVAFAMAIPLGCIWWRLLRVNPYAYAIDWGEGGAI